MDLSSESTKKHSTSGLACQVPISSDVLIDCRATPGETTRAGIRQGGGGGGAIPSLPAPAKNSGGAVAVAGGDGGASPSLVSIGHNSTNDIAEIATCPSAGWLRGECQHGTVRWIKLSCKRRDCPVCGLHRKHRIAWRIRIGVEELGRSAGAGWFVGTFDRDITKKKAVKTVGKMIRRLRKDTGIHFEYASTWELTKRGRLHVNIIMAPWIYIPQSKLSELWHRYGGGRRVWIERVGVEVANETAKDGREKIGNYVAKWEQMVLTGRGVTYSRGWPKLPDNPRAGRRGMIAWIWIPAADDPEDKPNDYLGYWEEVSPGEYTTVLIEPCDCFHLGPGKEDVAELVRPPPADLPAEVRTRLYWLELLHRVEVKLAREREDREAKARAEGYRSWWHQVVYGSHGGR